MLNVIFPYINIVELILIFHSKSYELLQKMNEKTLSWIIQNTYFVIGTKIIIIRILTSELLLVTSSMRRFRTVFNIYAKTNAPSEMFARVLSPPLKKPPAKSWKYQK